MPIALPGIPAQVVNLLQDRTLERVFHNALFPRLLYRSEAFPEIWQANLGESQVFTRTGLLPVKLKALTPGQDPVPSTYETEQWEAFAEQHGDTLDTHMPTSHVALASLFMTDAAALGLNGGQTMNRLARNRLFSAYSGGETVNTAVGAAIDTQIQVANINGFTQVLVNGRLQPSSVPNPIAISFPGTAIADNSVIGFDPADVDNPLGPGTLFLSAALGGGGLPLRSAVLAVSASRIIRVGGGATVDALSAASVLTLNDLIAAASRLRDQNVPPHADGYYHVHLPTLGEAQLFQDNHWQRLHQSLPDSAAYRDLAVGQIVGSRAYRNTESPAADTVTVTVATGTLALSAPEIGAEIRNETGVPINRTIVTGGGVLREKYLDESKYISAAGVQGKIGEFSIVNNGVAIMTERIRYILRAPQDKLGQLVAQTWSWSGDFPVPSDGLTGDGARFKRAVVIEHG